MKKNILLLTLSILSITLGYKDIHSYSKQEMINKMKTRTNSINIINVSGQDLWVTFETARSGKNRKYWKISNNDFDSFNNSRAGENFYINTYGSGKRDKNNSRHIYADFPGLKENTTYIIEKMDANYFRKKLRIAYVNERYAFRLSELGTQNYVYDNVRGRLARQLRAQEQIQAQNKQEMATRQNLLTQNYNLEKLNIPEQVIKMDQGIILTKTNQLYKWNTTTKSWTAMVIQGIEPADKIINFSFDSSGNLWIQGKTVIYKTTIPTNVTTNAYNLEKLNTPGLVIKMDQGIILTQANKFYKWDNASKGWTTIALQGMESTDKIINFTVDSSGNLLIQGKTVIYKTTPEAAPTLYLE